MASATKEDRNNNKANDTDTTDKKTNHQTEAAVTRCNSKA